MQTPYKRILTFDLETGGLSAKYNSITEIAVVAIDTLGLDIIEEFSVMIKPRIDLSFRDDPSKDAKILFKNIAEKDSETNIKTVKYKGQKVTLKNVSILDDDIKSFYKLLDEVYKDNILNYGDIIDLENSEHSDIFNLYYDNAYSPGAAEATKISRDMLIKNGINYEEAFTKVYEIISKHTIGNSKPIMAGHNIGWLPRTVKKGPNGFDNPFMEIFFNTNGKDYFALVNDIFMDTLQMARIRWYELPSYTLGSCANELGLTLKEAHRALPDTIANAKFLIKMLKSTRGEGAAGKSEYKRRKFTLNY